MNKWYNSLTALVILGGLIYFKQYTSATLIIIIGVFAYLELQWIKNVTQNNDKLMSLNQQLMNRLNYAFDVAKGVGIPVAHGINNVPPIPPKVESNNIIVDLPTLEGVHARKVRT